MWRHGYYPHTRPKESLHIFTEIKPGYFPSFHLNWKLVFSGIHTNIFPLLLFNPCPFNWRVKSWDLVTTKHSLHFPNYDMGSKKKQVCFNLIRGPPTFLKIILLMNLQLRNTGPAMGKQTQVRIPLSVGSDLRYYYLFIWN
jgi:hypothetical protein